MASKKSANQKIILTKKASISVNGKVYHKGDEIPAKEYEKFPERVKAFCEAPASEIKDTNTETETPEGTDGSDQ